MDLRALRYFVATAEELNITRAAEKLHMSQPPLSHQLRLLEEELGAPLFLRGKRRLQLTPEEGNFCCAGPASCWSWRKRPGGEIRQVQNSLSGRLCLGMVEGRAPYLCRPMDRRLLSGSTRLSPTACGTAAATMWPSGWTRGWLGSGDCGLPLQYRTAAGAGGGPGALGGHPAPGPSPGPGPLPSAASGQPGGGAPDRALPAAPAWRPSAGGLPRSGGSPSFCATPPAIWTRWPSPSRGPG